MRYAPSFLEDRPDPTKSAENVAPEGNAVTARPASGGAARGGLAIAGAKIYFMVTGLAQQIALGNILVGGGYGALSTVMGIASISYNPLIQSGIQGVSRPVAPASEAERPFVIRAALRVHFAFGVGAAVLFFLLAPLAAGATNTPYLVDTFRLFSGVLFAYGLYGPLVGILNGRQKFVVQAGLDVLAATLRTGAMVGAAWWFARQYGDGDRGAAMGFVASAAAMFLVAALLTGFGRSGPSPLSTMKHLRFIAPLLLGQFILNLLFQADLQLLGRFAREAAVAAGQTVEQADELVGAYRASQLFGFLPYQLLIAVSFVLFPMLARTVMLGTQEDVAELVRSGVRIAVVLAGAAVSISAGLAPQLLALVFPSQPFAEIAGNAMRVLCVGLGAFAIFGILISVLNSLGKERTSMTLTAGAFGLIIVSCALFVRGQPFGTPLLLRTAIATAVGHFAGTALAAWTVYQTAGGVVRVASVVRVLVAVAVCTGLSQLLPPGGKLMTLVYSALLAVVYLGTLIVLRELGPQDLRLVRAVLQRRAKAS